MDYAPFRFLLKNDGTLRSNRSIRENLEKALKGIDGNIRERQVEIAIAKKVGYQPGDDLFRHGTTFVVADTKKERIQGVEVITLFSDGKDSEKFYFSEPLNLYIRGEPEQRDDGLYCQITGEKISS